MKSVIPNLSYTCSAAGTIVALCFGMCSSAAAVDFLPFAPHELSGSEPESIVLQDFDGNQSADAAVTMYSGGAGEVSFRFNNGEGAFPEDGNLPLDNFGARGLAAGFFDSDSAADLAITNGVSGSSEVWIHAGNGDGTFSDGSSVNAGNFPVAIDSGDLNGDTFTDLAVANNNDNANVVSILLGDGNGAFPAVRQISLSPPFLSNDITIAEFNGDNHPDLAVANNTGVQIFLGTGNGNFTEGSSIGDSLVYAVAAGDLNGDALMDIFAAKADGKILFSRGNGDGSFQIPQYFDAVSPANTTIDMAVVDVDLNETPDVVITDQATDRIAVLAGTGEGTLQSPEFYPVGNEPVTLADGKLNSDDYPDVAVACRNAGDTPSLSVLLQKIPDHRGDVNRDGTVDLSDAVLTLQMLAGLDTSPAVHRSADVDNDLKIALEELVYILQIVSG